MKGIEELDEDLELTDFDRWIRARVEDLVELPGDYMPWVVAVEATEGDFALIPLMGETCRNLEKEALLLVAATLVWVVKAQRCALLIPAFMSAVQVPEGESPELLSIDVTKLERQDVVMVTVVDDRNPAVDHVAVLADDGSSVASWTSLAPTNSIDRIRPLLREAHRCVQTHPTKDDLANVIASLLQVKLPETPEVEG